MDEQMLLREFELLAGAPNAVPKLREMILDLAIRGGLQTQHPLDESAEGAIDLAEAEVRRLHDEGRITKPTRLSTPSRTSLPFEIPPSWVPVRLGQVMALVNGRAYKKNELLDAGTPVIRIQNLNGSDRWYYSNLELPPEKYCDTGDLLYSWSGTFGPYVWNKGRAIFHYHIWKVELTSVLSKEYAYLLLQAISADVKGAAHGIMLLHMTKGGMEKHVVPLPPFAEQRRIVAKVDKLMRLCDELESRQEKRSSVRVSLNTSALDALQKADREALPGRWQFVRDHFDLLYQDPQNVQKLKETILQLAVQGKLWGKQWDRVPLADLVAVVGGNTPSKQNASFWGGDIPWLSPKDIKGKHLWTAKDQITRKAVDHGGAKIVDPGAVLVVIRGMILAHTVPSSVLRVPAAINQDLKALTPSENLDAEFLVTALWACNSELLEVVQTSSHGTKRLPTEDLLSWHAPLPPINEQRRIVAKVDDLMRLCDELEGGLKRSEAKAEGLLEMVVREGVMTVGNTETASTR